MGYKHYMRAVTTVAPPTDEPVVGMLEMPYAVTYIDSIKDWWPPEKTLADLGVPGYNKDLAYNVINLAFWLPGSKDKKQPTGPTDVASIWADPVKYLGKQSGLGTTKDEILQNMMKAYHDAGVKVLISAFGATAPGLSGNWPDATETCTDLAQWALDNYLDGVDLDYECNDCMNKGTGEQWVIDCVKAIRVKMPAEKGYLLTHAPQGPYFFDNKTRYPGGAYLTVNKEVGDLTDWYNVQFYNQATTSYDTCETLFDKANGWATGTAVKEMVANGIDASKIVIGKPATPADAENTGYMHPDALEECIKNAGFKTGFMTWQFPNDLQSVFAKEVLKGF